MAKRPAGSVRAIGITNQRETTVVWNRKTGKAIHNAIVWQDRRGAPLCRKLIDDGWEPKIQAKTGLLIDSYFSATKVRWFLDNVPGAQEAAERGELAMGTIDSFVLWRLTGGKVHATDVTNACRTMLFNIHAMSWDEELLELFNVPKSMPPKVLECADEFGTSTTDSIGVSLPIAGIAGDQQAAMFGQGCHAPGMAKNTYGTGCFMLLHTGDKVVQSKNGLVATACAQTRAKEYALECSVFVGGAVVQWLRDQLGFFSSSSEVERLASEVLDSGDVFVVPAFTGLGAPYWDPNARGTIVGLTRGTTRAHIARAALESIAFQSAEVLEAMQKDSGEKLAELRVDGGAAANDLLMQFQADLLGVPVVRPRVLETTALGAAYLAGLSVDLWKSREELAQHWQIQRRFEPRMDLSKRQNLMGRWREAVGRARNWV
jgi:glycerol kinase